MEVPSIFCYHPSLDRLFLPTGLSCRKIADDPYQELFQYNSSRIKVTGLWTQQNELSSACSEKQYVKDDNL